MLKIILVALLPLLAIFSDGSDQTLNVLSQSDRDSNTGTLEKIIPSSGSVTMDVNLARSTGGRLSARMSRPSSLHFDIQTDSFFPVQVFNGEVRGPLPGSMTLVSQTNAALPGQLATSYRDLIIERTSWGEPYELVVRDAKSGFVFFNIEGHEYDYDANEHTLSIQGGRLLLSKEFAADLGRPADTGSVVGQISITAAMRVIEVTQIVEGEVKSDVLPPMTPSSGTVPGPDVIVGDLSGLAQFGASAGTQVGLAVGTDSCNAGTIPLNWIATPGNDHPVIPQNLYRMSGGATNNERFEQVGQSSVKHAFTALQDNICGFGCNANPNGTALGSGCSDPYVASLNAGPNLGSRAWINPFTGAYPRADSATPPNNHSGHVHNGPAHKILAEVSDLNTTLNPGASYFAEAQYITPHEYTWCQANPGQCNMYNNVSFRQYTVTGTTCASGSSGCYGFSPTAATVRSKPAITAWTGATLAQIMPDPVNDGVGTLGYKVTNPSAGVWHYEYALYNQNLDRAIQSFSFPLGGAVILSNIGFHAPPQQPGWAFDGTVGNAGFSNTPWAQGQSGGVITWSSETFAQNQNANAIRWGTMYNFRFDANRPPQLVTATIGFYKNGSPITVQIMAPTSPPVSVSGRLATAVGNPIGNARVSITDSGNNTRVAITNSFGNYRFDNVAAGGTYTISAKAKSYTIAPQVMLINDNLTGVNLTAVQN